MSDCNKCKAMEVLEELQRRLYANDRYEDFLDELTAAMKSVNTTVAKPAGKAAWATTTCVKPGCTSKIQYDPDAPERPLYCKKHMPEYTGRNMKRTRK